MKKLSAVLVALVLVLTMCAAVAEQEAFTFRNGVKFGMTQQEVRAAETGARAELDRERIPGGKVFEELELEHVTHEGMRGDLHYFFQNDRLVAARVDYDMDHGIAYDQVRNALAARYGETAAVTAEQLGSALYLLDDDGFLGRRQDAWQVGSVIIMMHQDGDDIEILWADATAF